MAIWSDMNGFPESGFPVLADVSDRICLGTLNQIPLAARGYIIDVVGAVRLGAVTISATGALACVGLAAGGAISAATTIAANNTVTLSSATAPLTMSGAEAVMSMSGNNAVFSMTGLNASIGTILARIRRGWFRDLDTYNVPTVQGEPVVIRQDLAQYVPCVGVLLDVDLGTHTIAAAKVLTPEVKTDTTTPTDLTVTTGAAKTMVLATPVYNDANVGSLILQTGGTLPGIVEILDNDGDATGIYTRGFAVGEQGSGSIEIPHDYKEGTDLSFHVHWGANDAPSGTDNVRWRVIYSLSRDGSTFPDSITVSADDTPYDTQYKWLRTDFVAIAGATGGVDGGVVKIGDQFNFTLTRIAASGDAYAGEALVATIGIHYQCDTIGSRSIGTK